MLKKMIALLLVCILSLTGCSSHQTETLSSDDSPVQQSTIDTSRNTLSPEPISYLTYCSLNGSSKFEKNSINCAYYLNNLSILNAGKSIYHLPVLQIDNRLDIQNFLDEYGELFELEDAVSEVPSFVDITDNMDDSYFNSYSLLIVYIRDDITSKALKISYISKDKQSVVVHLIQEDDVSEMPSLGRLIIIPIEKHLIGENVSIDTILDDWVS